MGTAGLVLANLLSGHPNNTQLLTTGTLIGVHIIAEIWPSTPAAPNLVVQPSRPRRSPKATTLS